MTDYLTFSSNSLAFRAEQALLAAGMTVAVVPRPPGMVGRCALALKLPPGSLEAARGLLAARHIPILKAHALTA